eukprot:gb/GFBE01058462.1/.p1 GENE.gb/GFBE01058462.1/~~gb/GFBE01058462.1/.p1  ORF type:complete len:504 (+),score=70.10 gb/GFBE01058462.1/:1-1512(+)
MALAATEPQQAADRAEENHEGPAVVGLETDALSSSRDVALQIQSEQLGVEFGFRRFHLWFVCALGIIQAAPAVTIGTGLYVQGQVLQEFKPHGVSPAVMSLVTSSVMLGSSFGTIACGELGDRFGRRKSLATCIVALALISLLHFFVPSGAWGFPCLVLLRVILGIAYGGFIVLPGVYISELVEDRWRGAAIANLTVFWHLGSLSAVQFVALNHGQSWRTLMAVAPLVPCNMGLMALVAVPESPRWLLVTGKTAAARNVLDRIFASQPLLGDAVVGRRPDVTVASTLPVEQQVKRSLVQDLGLLFEPALQRYTVMASLIYLLVAGANNTAWIYGPVLLQKVTGRSVHDNMHAFALSEIAGVLGAVTGMALVDVWGRKPLVTAACSLKIVSFSVLTYPAARGIATGLWATQGFVDTILWATVGVLVTEIFPTDLRGVGVGFACMGGRIASVVFPLIAGQVLTLGAGALCAYLTCCYLAILIVVYFQEETARTTLRDVHAGKKRS